jgi:subtilisin family serine protease
VRLDSELSRLVAAAEPDPAPDGDTHPSLSDSVAVTVRMSHNVSAVAGFIGQNGGVVANTGVDYIEAYVPVSALVALQSVAGVLRIGAIMPPQADITSEGAALHGSPTWNAGGVTGAGIKVGIIDVGFIGYGGLMGGELPSTVVARCYTAIGTFTSTLSNCETVTVHGAAVAEAVVDVAPGVSLYIANPQSGADLQATASWMVSEGVRVINHSAGWVWEGPGDGTSSFSDSALGAVDIAVTGGAVWVNSAGNSAQSNWFGSYSDANSNNWLEFSGVLETNPVELTAGSTLVAQLRWEGNWGNAASDLDLALYDSSLTLVAFSTSPQSGGLGQNSYESLTYIAPSTGTYHLAAFHVAGSAPSWVQLNSFFGQGLLYSVAATSVGTPAESASAGMLAVGASNWATPTTIEPFSSRGPTTDGRTKPDITGADNGNSVTSGHWFGTSQAAPHVAGLAALVLDRFPEFTPAQVASYLKTNSLPRKTVPNNTWGYGLAQLAALPPGAPTNVTATGGNGQASVAWAAPGFNGGAAITQYTVTSNPGGLTTIVGGSTLIGTVSGLTNGTSYTFSVTATNIAGTSDSSLSSNAVTPEALLPTPTPMPTVTPTPVPGVSQWGVAILLGLLVLSQWVRLKRRPDASR